jgi:hypothetical protein
MSGTPHVSWLIAIAVAFGTVILLLGGAVVLSTLRFDDHIADLRHRLAQGQTWPRAGSAVLPEIVRNYAVAAGGKIGAIQIIHCRQRASLTVARGQPAVMIDADQWVGTVQPGIVWSAAGWMTGLPVKILDAFVDGKGELTARLAGFLTVAGGTGPDYDKGELMRFLSELPLHPDAILNMAALQWKLLDTRTVAVTAQSASGPATVRFIFNEAGEIIRMEADDRPMSENGRTIPTAWHGTYSDYRSFGSYRLPAHGEVGWAMPDGLFTYWRGELIGYDVVRQGNPIL